MRQRNDFFKYHEMLELAAQRGDLIEIVQLTRTEGDRELGLPPDTTETAIAVKGYAITGEFTEYPLATHGASMSKFSHTVYILAEDPNFDPSMITANTRIRVNGNVFKQVEVKSPPRYRGNPKMYVYQLSETTESELII